MNRKHLVFLAAYLLIHSFLFAENDNPALKLDLPLIDLPYQVAAMNTVDYGFFSSYANPSMAQSLAVTQNIYSSFHYGMKYFYDNSGLGKWSKRFIFYGGISLGHFLFTWMPGASTWLHEEYHRAVLTRFGANSFNPTNRFPIGAVVMAVEVGIDDMIRIQEESASDYVRLYEAGIEGQYVLVDRMQRDNFFHDQQLPHEIGYLFNTVNSHMYVQLKQGDFLFWVSGLFRPDVSHEENDEFTADDLTDDELKYLSLHGYLQILNYLSPMMFGIRTLPLGNTGYEMNFAMRHYLTSFGADIAATVFLKMSPFNMVFALHNYVNHNNYFPAIEAELVDYQIYLGKLGLYLSPRILIGMQPKNQEFKTDSPEFLGLFGLRVDFMVSKHFLPYLDFSAKTDGWVAGNAYLNANASIKLGVSMRF